jgi:hypothetical protein
MKKSTEATDIERGVAYAVHENFPYLEAERIYEAVSEGIENAMWRMITGATGAPCADFYATIEKAAEKAFSKVTITASEE